MKVILVISFLALGSGIYYANLQAKDTADSNVTQVMPMEQPESVGLSDGAIVDEYGMPKPQDPIKKNMPNNEQEKNGI